MDFAAMNDTRAKYWVEFFSDMMVKMASISPVGKTLFVICVYHSCI